MKHKLKNNGFNTPQIDILATRVTAVGDKVVDIPGFDEAVESVVVKFRCGKMIECLHLSLRQMNTIFDKCAR